MEFGVVKFPVAFVLLLMLAGGSDAGVIGVYWGQVGAEGSLFQACSTGIYKYVNIAYLSTFGNGTTPSLDLDTHCFLYDNCAFLSSEIQECQAMNVKVLLSLGGPKGNYFLSSEEEAQSFAAYLYNNFLGGSAAASSPRPLGDVVLDGIDFHIDGHGSKYWGDLAQALTTYSSSTNKVYLTAAVDCSYPDPWTERALKTSLFDIVWVQFYNNPRCEYNRDYPYNINNMIYEWNQWVNSSSARNYFLGLVSSPASGYGYIPPRYLTSIILPALNGTAKYGGVILRSRFFDKQTYYSFNIRPFV